MLTYVQKTFQNCGAAASKKEWESGLLGKTCIQISFSNPKIYATALFSSGIKALKAYLEQLGSGMIMCRLPSEMLESRRTLEEAGFHLIECYLALETDLIREPHPMRDTKSAIRHFSVKDTEALAALAGNAFSFSRFHLDPEITDDIANLSRTEWVRNACRGRADFILVSVEAGVISGFVIARRKEDLAILDLMAVPAACRNRGIGKSLVKTFLSESLARGALKAQVGTQAHNIPALKIYQWSGFRPFSTSYTYHCHI